MDIYFFVRSIGPPDVERALNNRSRWRSIVEEQLIEWQYSQPIRMAQPQGYWQSYYLRTSIRLGK